ncbi:MAG: hypothetical protein OXE94_12820 [Aestuariivita sp.]|nr:hypothetical protein [Aestuariivita sp.]MCY4203212.1 hypothetical protein [Aestuariivita sp.]
MPNITFDFFEACKSNFTGAGDGKNEEAQSQAGHMIVFGQPAIKIWKVCVGHGRDMCDFITLPACPSEPALSWWLAYQHSDSRPPACLRVRLGRFQALRAVSAFVC